MNEPIRAITMPKWGLAMTEGQVIEWHVAEGADIGTGDEIIDIETTKITNVLESPAGGTLRRLVAVAGVTLPVGALLGVVADPATADADIDAFIEAFNANFEVAAAAEAEAAPEPQLVEVGGLNVNYLVTGGGDGLPVVLVHGFGGDLNNWMFNQPALSEGRTVYALDLPGHGRSGKAVEAGDVAAMAAALAGFLDAVSVDKAHLAGHSMGGAIVLQLAADHPDRAASLTLVSPAGLGPEINMDYINGFMTAGRRKEMKGVLQTLFADPSLVSRDMIDEILKYKRLDGVDRALQSIAGAAFPGGVQGTLLKDQLGSSNIPVQVIWGRDDRIIPAGHADGLPANVSVHILDDVGHMAHMEAAGEVNRLLAEIAGQGSIVAVPPLNELTRRTPRKAQRSQRGITAT